MNYKLIFLVFNLLLATVRNAQANAPQDTLVRFVLLLQEELLNRIGESNARTYMNNHHLFLERSLSNSSIYFNLGLGLKVEDTATQTQTLNLVKILSVPDNELPDTATSTAIILTKLRMPNDGFLDRFSPDSLRRYYNQAKVVLVVNLKVASNNGFAYNDATVIRQNAFIPPVVGITTHEETHLFGAQHEHAWTAPKDVVINNKVILPEGKSTIENGVGPYYALSSIIGAPIIWSGKDGIVESSKSHPSLHVIASGPDTVVKGQQFSITTLIHDSWVNTSPIVSVQDEIGMNLWTGNQSTSMMSIPVTSSMSVGNSKYIVRIYNPPTEEFDYDTIDIYVKNVTETDNEIDDDGFVYSINGKFLNILIKDISIKSITLTSISGQVISELINNYTPVEHSVELPSSSNTFILVVNNGNRNFVTKIINLF